jgi:phage tail-like protein
MSATRETPRRRDVLLHLLPEIYQDQPSLAAFLEPFETVLFGAGSGEPNSLDRVINGLPDLLDPLAAPDSYLPWLAGWMGVALHPDLDAARRRALIQHASALYRRRGTKAGIEELLRIVTGNSAVVAEPEIRTLQVGFSRVGETTRLGGERPHYFEVRLAIPVGLEAGERARIERIARAFVDRAKPAYTQYTLVTVPAETASATTPTERS